MKWIDRQKHVTIRWTISFLVSITRLSVKTGRRLFSIFSSFNACDWSEMKMSHRYLDSCTNVTSFSMWVSVVGMYRFNELLYEKGTNFFVDSPCVFPLLGCTVSTNLYRPASRTNYGLARFRVMASKIWETIPIEIKCLSHSSFKMQYKLFLLGNQT